jgi:periplasmic protein TonB
MMGYGDPDARTRPVPRTTFLRWTIAAVAVLLLHGTGVWFALHGRTLDEPQNAPAPAVEIDLAPLAVAPNVPTPDVALGPQQTKSEIEPTPAPEPSSTPPVAQPVPDAQPPPVSAPQPDVKVPQLPEKDDAEAALAPPLPPSRPRTRKRLRKPPTKTQEVARQKHVRLDKRRVERTTAPPSSQARRAAEKPIAPSAGDSFTPSMSPADWKGELMAQLNRYKRYPAGASGSGAASVAFTINRSGRVLSARLIGSSGDSALDAEAVSLPRRASPVPPPPPNIGGRVITLTVPIHFDE